MQIDFAEALFAAAKENGINTAIESTGFAPFENIERVLPYIDYYLMDIKHMDSEKHKAFTTQPNELILKNAPLIAAKTNLTVRVPVIPTFNDTEEEIGRHRTVCKDASGRERDSPFAVSQARGGQV